MKPEQGPEHLRFGGGVSATVIHPLVLVVILLAGALILFGPRRRAILPFLLASILIPMDQVLMIGSAHFPMLRMLLLFGFVRIVKDKAISKVGIFSRSINKIDVGVILLTLFIALNGVLLFQESGAVFNQLGNIYTVFGVYFLMRFLIRDEEDVVRTIKTLACITAAVALVMTYEIATGHNPYALLGGARAADYASVSARADRFRAQGPFGHPILAGTFGAVLVPLFMALWWKSKKYRGIALMGGISGTVLILACNSSTPVLGYAAGIAALCLWPLRGWMRAIRWGIVVTLVSLHLVMKAPVWNLIARIDITGGSSGYHRYMLIDQCIRHFRDWWLVGVKDTSVWGWDMWDTANQYVGTCDASGLVPFVLFVAILVYGFKYLGRAARVQADKRNALFIWSFGAALFANVVAFFGISYWDQTIVPWYALLAMISTVTALQKNKAVTASLEDSSNVTGLLPEPEGQLAFVDEALVQAEPLELGERPAAWHQIN